MDRKLANVSKSRDQNLWRNNTQNRTFLTSKAWPHLTCHPAQPGEFMALASLAAITAFSVSKGSFSSSASTGILLAPRPSSLSVFRKRKYLSVSFYEGWRLHVQIWVEVFWGFHLTLFLAFQQIHSSTSQCSFAKKAHRMNKKTRTPYGMKHAQQHTVIYSHTQCSIATHLDFLRLPGYCIWMCLVSTAFSSFWGSKSTGFGICKLIQSMVGSTVPQFNHPFGLPLLSVKSHGRHFGLGAKQFLVSFLSEEKCMPNWISVISYGLVKKQLVTAALQVVCSYQMSIILQTSDK